MRENQTQEDQSKALLSKEVLKQVESEDEIAAFVAIRLLYDRMKSYSGKNKVEIMFNLKQLNYQLTGEYELSKVTKEKLTKGVEEFIADGYVTLLNKDGKGEYVIDAKAMHLRNKKEVGKDESPDAFVIVYQSEIQRICRLEHKRRFNILHFAAGLLGTINYDSQCGWCSFRAMPFETGIKSVSTCQEYLKVLENVGIIYVHHSEHAKRNMDGTYLNLSNYYGRPEDKEFVDFAYEQNVSEQGYDYTNMLSDEKKREVSRDYNKYLKGKFNGDVIQLIRDCIYYNRIPSSIIYHKQKDLTVFSESDLALAEQGLDQHIKQVKKQDKPKMRKFGISAKTAMAIKVDFDEDLDFPY